MYIKPHSAHLKITSHSTISSNSSLLIYLTGLKTSHPFKLSISSGSSSIKLLPLPNPVPVLGGNAGLSSLASIKFPTAPLPTGFLSAAERRGGGGYGRPCMGSGSGSSR